MTLKRVCLIVAAGAVGLVSAIAVLPARWLIHSIPVQWPLVLIDASGSIWQGRGVLAIGPPGMQRTLPEPVQWAWQWQWGARPTVKVVHPWLTGPLVLTPGVALPGVVSLHVGAQRLRLPASVLSVAGAPFNSMEPGGQVQVSWSDLQVGAGLHVGPLLQVQWTDASTTRVRVRPLGNYSAALARRADRTLTLYVETQSGALRIQGSGSAAPGSPWRFNGTARAAPEADPAIQDALMPLLSMLGRRSGDITTLQY